jgi:hypothetical protein
MTGMGRTSPFPGEGRKIWNRRVSRVASSPGEGLLTERLFSPEGGEFFHPPKQTPAIIGVVGEAGWQINNPFRG